MSTGTMRPIRDVMTDTGEYIDNFQTGKLRPLYTSSKAEMELLTGIYPGDLVVLAAASGMGKTARLIRLLLNFCSKTYNPDMYKKVRVDFHTWEMADIQVCLRLLACQMYIRTKDMLKFESLTPEMKVKLQETMRTLSNLPMRLDHIPKDLEEYKDTCLRRCDWAKKNDVQQVFAMDHTRMAKWSNEKSEERKITGFLEAQVVIKKHPAKPIFIDLSQLNRNYETRLTEEQRGQSVPIKSDIFGSDAVFQCADLVSIFHRPGYYGVPMFQGKIPTGIGQDKKSRDNLWVEAWLKQREGESNVDVYMTHQIEFLKFNDIKV